MEPETKQYELNYVLKGDLDQETAEQMAEKLRDNIEKEGGIVSETDKPQKKALGYPIKKHETGYFGWFQFILPADKIDSLAKSFAKFDVLRCLINNVRYNQEISRKATRKKTIRRIKTIKEILPASPKDETSPADLKEEPKEALQVEEIDKKLEEILRE